MNNTNLRDKEIIKAARIAGIKLNSIKTTDLEGRFPPNIGGFSYDKEQIESLANFAKECIANMQKTIEQKDALIATLKLNLGCIENGVPRSNLGTGDQCIHLQYGYENCDACYQDYAEKCLKSISSPVSEKEK